MKPLVDNSTNTSVSESDNFPESTNKLIAQIVKC